MLTQVTTRNIEYGLSLPDQVQAHLRNQMLAQAYLTAELVALAERPEASSPEDISMALQRVIDLVREHGDGAFITDFAVTGSEGRPYIATRNRSESEDPTGEIPQLPEKLMPLLSPGAGPVTQLGTGEGEEEATYVGVPGADKPRIVQVSADPKVMDEMASFFSVQQLIERFMIPEEYWGIAIVDSAGNIVAEAGDLNLSSFTRLREKVIQLSIDFLRSPEDGVAFEYIGRQGGLGWDLGVVTPLLNPSGEVTHALFIMHNASSQLTYILDRLGVLITVGFALFMASLIVSIFLSRGLSKPLLELAKGAREFGAGNFNYRVRMKRKDEFNDLAQSINTMAISIQEYVHELEQETSRRERLESEFRIAADLQRTLLPEAPPLIEGLELIGWSQASKDVGGDFYDFIEMGDGRVAVVLGDATGKGLSAALLSTECSSVLRTLADQTDSPGDLLYRTNNEFFKRIGATHRFVTLFLMIIDTRDGTATYASAGHPPPLLVNPGTEGARWLESEAGYPLGIVNGATFSETEIRLEAHDTILIYSDGLTDAQNPASEMYGVDRIERILQATSAEPSEELLRDLREDAEKHMDGKDPIDDMTIVVVRFNPLVKAEVRPT
ncbi:MAG: SpoIIE family protein phosphatase [Candidatus Hydrogenedentes bacterium]|nr:SpoIIE family protein phosphatase [Candidatus Hydrogenedentota bacterium]